MLDILKYSQKMRKVFPSLFQWYFIKYIFNAVRTNPVRLLVYGTILMVFVVELFSYYFITLFWSEINCEKSVNCIRILLAADPQIIGLHQEPIPWLTPISIWDSDRYLEKTFFHAFHFTRPDVVIFLGDLFDEGSTATDEEFKRYYHRLLRIFRLPQYHSASYIWLPGDNDIGGEGNDLVTADKVKHFDSMFSQPNIMSFNDIVFYKFNEMLSSIPTLEYGSRNGTINVGLSHMPLLSRLTSFVEKFLDTVKPSLLFTAHTHHSSIVKITKSDIENGVTNSKAIESNTVYKYNISTSTICEITVPTCSYRMGTTKIGYGFVIIENQATSYTVLWSPSRYSQLTFYVMTLLFICICTTYRYCRHSYFTNYLKKNILL